MALNQAETFEWMRERIADLEAKLETARKACVEFELKYLYAVGVSAYVEKRLASLSPEAGKED